MGISATDSPESAAISGVFSAIGHPPQLKSSRKSYVRNNDWRVKPTTMSLQNYLPLTLAIVIIFSSCKKQMPDQNLDSPAKSSTLPAGTVMTPIGPMEASNIHIVEKGYGLSYRNGHVYKVESASGKIAEDLGEVQPDSLPNRLAAAMIRKSGRKTGAGVLPSGADNGDNWVTYAEWDNTTGEPITLFSTYWTVPEAPTNNNGSETELIYIWDGMTPNGPSAYPLLQPVLQWGNNSSWGGKYWSAATWCIFSNTLAAITSPTLNISSGTALQGEVSFQGTQADGSYNYIAEFTNYPSIALNMTQGYSYNKFGGGTGTVPQFPELNSVFEVLEDPNEINAPSEYPPQLSVDMDGISVQVGPQAGSYTPAPLNWEYTANGTVGATMGEHTAVVSNNSNGQGQVDLFFEACASPIPGAISGTPSWNESTLTLSWGAAANATSYELIITAGPDGGAFYNTSATTITNFFNTIEANNKQGTYTVEIIPQGPCGNGPGTYFTFNNCTNTLSAPTGVSWNNSTLTLSWSAVSGATEYEMIITSGPDGGAFYETSSTSISNFFNTIEANNTPGNYTVEIIPQYVCGNGPGTYYSFTH
jgi:hypothetical protein